MTQILPPTSSPQQPQAPPFLPGPPPRSPRPAQRPRRAGFAALVLSGALLVGGGAGVGGAAVYDALRDDPASPAAGTANSPLQVADSQDREAPDGSVESVAAAVLPSVVALDVSAPGGSGSGSGVVLDQDGLILTNDHVITLGGEVDADQVQITASFSDGTKARATVVGTDPLTDTAIVKVEDVDNLVPVTIGTSGDLDVGEQVVAIGSPFGLDATVTSGIVSALDRPVQVGSDQRGNLTAYPAIQTDAAINPGNSGGPLVNMDGQLVGINASIRSTTSGANAEAGSIGLGFAIPIDSVLPIIEQLRAGETPTHARLGIQISPAATQSDPTASGARIEEVERGSAAADAGLEQGDIVIRIEDRRIADSEALVALVRSYRPGDTVEVTYLRGGTEDTTELELGSDG